MSVRAGSIAAALPALALTACSSGPEPGELAGWNVLLVTVDTMRGDRAGFAGYDRAETPAMDGLADGGVVFENAVSLWAGANPKFFDGTVVEAAVRKQLG